MSVLDRNGRELFVGAAILNHYSKVMVYKGEVVDLNPSTQQAKVAYEGYSKSLAEWQDAASCETLEATAGGRSRRQRPPVEKPVAAAPVVTAPTPLELALLAVQPDAKRRRLAKQDDGAGGADDGGEARDAATAKVLAGGSGAFVPPLNRVLEAAPNSGHASASPSCSNAAGAAPPFTGRLPAPLAGRLLRDEQIVGGCADVWLACGGGDDALAHAKLERECRSGVGNGFLKCCAQVWRVGGWCQPLPRPFRVRGVSCACVPCSSNPALSLY
jgi:hypothetical protein